LYCLPLQMWLFNNFEDFINIF